MNPDSLSFIQRRKVMLGVVGLIILLWLVFATTVTIGTGKIAVMTRFGKVTGQELGEGFHFKSPLDTANEYDIKVLKEETKAAAASKDLQDVASTLVINYRLEAGKISEIHRTVGVLYKEKLIDPAVQEVFKGATAKFDATQLITDRPSVKADAFNELVNRLERYGIIVQDLSITDFSFSPEFTNAIEAKQVAAQEAERAKFNLDKANLDAQSQNAQKTSLSPELLQKYAIDKWDGKMPQYVGGGSVFNIPLGQ
ncbi:prohibitin family protein [Candidatus Saccharibacteria bacterium]|nr:prohibitin family protein [Candidatus Saccharibacteria bacterium]